MMMNTTNVGEYLCVGDYICLYSVETEGYAYGLQSSSVHSQVYLYRNQDKDKPNNIPCAQGAVFQVCIQNRYKLNKKLRKYMSQTNSNANLLEDKTFLNQHKIAAEAENTDNAQEQKRQMGKRVRYGEIIQLKHAFTNKFVHMCASQTSQIDKNNMMVMLQEYNAKNAQFRLLPQYKVKSEGEVVQIYDQIVFESIKSPGHFLHASAGFQIDHFTFGSEINLGVERSGFTLVRFHKHASSETEMFVRGGSIIRLFHKELEAYMVAEGLFNDEVTEDVHFRIRVMDQHKPRTLSPPTSGNTFWTIEAENSIFNGGILQWEQQIRLRHMTTRKYLCIDANREISLVDSNEDPRTVFRLHSVISERDEIRFESYCRIEHVLTGFWLHALKDEDYIRKKFRDVESINDQTLRGLRWDSAMVRQVSASGESQYDDAFTIQMVEDNHVHEFNYVAGCVPFLQNLIKDRETKVLLNAKKTHQILTAMEELRKFMMLKNLPNKNRQKLMRNLRVIDLLVKILQCPLDGVPDEQNIILVFKEAYEILYTYMIGKSRKNALYFAKYIEFFQTQFTQKGGIGLNVAQMIVELIRDKRKIVDRISHSQIDEFVSLLQSSQNYRFLDLLHVLCVCDDVAIPNNQSYIVERWMQCEQKGIFLTARGQDINRQPNILYISTNCGRSWHALHEFVDEANPSYDKDQHEFLLHQLDLYIALCWGRNDYAINIITKELRYLTWEETFLALRSDILPDAIRAKYCDMTTSLFVDIGNNYSVLAHPNICFVYDYVGSKDEEKSQGDFIVKELVAIFPVLRDWIAEFLSENKCMIASDIGHNMLIEQVVRLLYYLVMFGYYMDAEDVEHLLPPLLNLLDGRKDFPIPKDKEKGYSKDAMKKVQLYQGTERFEANFETQAIINAKYQVLEVLDLLLTYQRNSRLQSFVTKFKFAEQIAAHGRNQGVMTPLLYDAFDPHDQSKKALGIQKKVNRELRDMFNLSAIFDVEFLTKVLVDLTMYKYDKMVSKSLNILNKIYSSKMNMFNLASKAQILLTQDSARVHREVLKNMPILRRLARAKLDDQQVKLMGNILDDLAEFCHLPMTPDEPHPMNQNIMISNGILNVLFDILIQEIDTKLLKMYGGMTDIFKKAFYLLKLLARENMRVQHHIMERLDILLDVRVVESDLAIALKEVFCGNSGTCLKISPRQIQKIVNRAADMQDRAPEFLDLLGMIVKVVGTNLTLKRNQAYVMKYIMQNYKKVAFVLDMSREERLKILTESDEISRLRYYLSLLELLAACAEGENMFIESLCQTILPIDDLLWVLNNDKVDNVYKKPFLKCLHHVYMKSGDAVVEAGASELSHFGDLWDYMSKVSVEMNRLTDSVKEDPDKIAIYIKTAPEKSGTAAAPDFESSAYGSVLYFLESVLPFLEGFYRDFYFPDAATHPNELDETDHIAKAIVMFGEIVGPLLFKPQHMKNLVNALTIVVPISNMPNSNLEHVLDRFASGITVEDTSSAIRRDRPLHDPQFTKFVQSAMLNFFDIEKCLHCLKSIVKGNIEYYSDEVEINAKFRTFTKNCSLVFSGHNTVSAQLKVNSKREYTELGGDEELPLGEEFQSLIKCFIQNNEKKVEKKFEWTAKLIEQLHISIDKKRLTEHARMEMDDLNIKCLQILRAIIHNEERKLPEDWQTRTSEHKIKNVVKHIHKIQVLYNSKHALKHALPHIATRCEVLAKEVLGFVCILLLNANQEVQKRLVYKTKITGSNMQQQPAFRTLNYITLIQNYYDIKGSMRKCLPHLATRNEDVAREVLGFLCIMLFNANAHVQQSMLDYFLSTREEVFFMAVRDRMALSTNTIKEKRSLETQMEAQRKKDTSKSASKRTQHSFAVTVNALKQVQAYEDALKQQRLSGWKPKHQKNVKQVVKKKKPKQVVHKVKKDKKNKVTSVKFANGAMKEEEALMDNAGFEDTEMTEIKVEVPQILEVVEETESVVEDEEIEQEDSDTAQEYRNDGYIELVLKVMARMCDGQNHHLQDYLREQPDNLKSFNIIGEVTQFLNVIYSNITGKNIDLTIQLFESINEFTADYLREQPDNLKTFNIIAEVSHFVDYIFSNISAENILLVIQTFETMVEFTAGNQDNRIVIYDNKIIDYINFILRAGDFEDCSTDKILSLRESISNLVISLVEENGPGKSQVAMEVKDTIDKKAIFSLMTECYEQHAIDKKKLEELKYIQIEGVPPPSKNKALTKAGESLLKGFKKKERNEFADQYMDVGFRLYLILARMVDIDPKLLDNMKLTPLEMKAYNYYKKNCMSIEVVKEDELQKVNFRVKSKRVLREEVKEMLKWNVDRSSPSNKIRDLMEWSKDIMKDIAYQRKILSNPIAIVLTKGWLVWNHLVTILSFAINVLMLLTWNAKASLSTPGIMGNSTAIPQSVLDPIPVITTLTQQQYTMAIYIMGGTHNFFCLLVFLSYFLGNHPSLPNPKAMWQAFKDSCSRKKKDEDTEEEKEKKHQSKMDAKFLSFTTFYYMAFLALSVGGTVFHGYFFAFHLLNIVNNNQLLGGVIKAVTQNGRSLLWVGVLGLVVFYLYAIIGFALMRSMFSPSDYLYCDSLWQCTITVIRYGLIGDLFENMKAHSTQADFALFGFVVIYHVSFFIFITTIGLNIIFGIIVDTFSELRDLKWTAESDMRDTCFICSRNSYDFEHHGKGFEHHVRQEHNMWSYIFFFIHLNGTKVNDYTALEMFVYKLLQKENYDFYPLDRALSLASMGQDSTETKIDDLLFQVTTIVEKQKREELEKKRREERMRQKQWEQKHRLGSFRRKAKLPTRSIESDPLSGQGQDEESPLQGINQQLGLDSPPPFSPSYSRRPSETGGTAVRRSSLIAPGPGGQPGYSTSVSRHDRFRRRRSVSPLDPRDTLFRRSMSPSRFEDDEEPLIHGAASPRYDERAMSPTLYGVDNELLDISPVPISRRQSYEMSRSPRLSLATSPREHTSFFAETDPIPYLRQLSAERRASASYSEGRPLTLQTDRGYDDRDTESQYDSDDPTKETRF